MRRMIFKVSLNSHSTFSIEKCRREIFFFSSSKIQLVFNSFRSGDGTSDVTVTWLNLQGLSEGEHGFHIHQYGDITSNSPATTGFHFVPDQICSPCEIVNSSEASTGSCTDDLELCLSDSRQGWPPSQNRHPGDMGNITADANGETAGSRVLGQGKMSLEDSLRSIIGRAVSIHQNPDNGTSPWGFAGPQVAWGVVGIANPADFGASSSDENPSVCADATHVSDMVCHFRGTLDGASTRNVRGTVLLQKPEIGSDTVTMYGKLSGLSKGAHSFHFHEWGSISNVGDIFEPVDEVLMVGSSTLDVPVDNEEFRFTGTFTADTMARHIGRSLTIHDGPTSSDATIARSVCGFANVAMTTPESLGFETSSSSSNDLNGGEIFAIILVVLLAVGAIAYVVYLVQTGQAFEHENLGRQDTSSAGDIEVEAMDMDAEDDEESDTAPIVPGRVQSLRMEKVEA